ncbi:MAG: sigma-70 family RNA polymerase sigma factor [Chitinophagales bacterium]|nr:sigma-70 family RNA polymerase sigma factor [Chitinophagaceae bacterium]MCB9064517.1 sigma-70 family RNA polymerase sigma factor [Chitinophagales bacterium]
MVNKATNINLSDEELLKLHRSAADSRWLGVLLERYTVLLLGVGIKYLKDKDEAADAVQQVFLKVLTSLPEEEMQNFKGWLYILMRNHCYQLLRNKKHNQGEAAIENHSASGDVDIKELYELELTIDELNESLTELDEGQQVCIKLFYLHKMTYQQIMEQKGFSFMQVKSHIQNGKRKLKKLLLEKRQNRK